MWQLANEIFHITLEVIFISPYNPWASQEIKWIFQFKFYCLRIVYENLLQHRVCCKYYSHSITFLRIDVQFIFIVYSSSQNFTKIWHTIFGNRFLNTFLRAATFENIINYIVYLERLFLCQKSLAEHFVASLYWAGLQLITSESLIVLDRKNIFNNYN